MRVIRTSNFATSGRDPNAVAISNGVGHFKGIRVYKPLVPPWWLVKRYKDAEITAEYFAKIYNGQLAALDPNTVKRELGKDAILLCWESQGSFCHRRLVAQWLESRLGITVEEIGKAPPPVATTGTLFG